MAGRTSSFHFKGRNEDLHAIGAALGVQNVLEGSVRKQGNKVRITAQLIKAKDGFHLWSRTYDGELTDVFELQERIARAITDELKVVLQGDPRARLVPVATRNPEAYALYLQATAIFNRRDGTRFADAISQLEQALVLDPGYARAHSRLAALHAVTPSYSARDVKASLAAAEKHARRAIELDSGLAEPHAVLGLLLSHQRRWEEEGAAFQRALALDPDDVTANFWYATTLIVEGYARRGAEVLDRVLVLDPILPNALMWRGTQLFNNGELDPAERLLQRANDLGLFYVGLGLSAVSDARGRKEEAVERITPALRVFLGDFAPGSAEVLARGIFGDDAARAKALALVEGYLATKPAVVTGIAPYALIRLGQPERALEVLQAGPTGNDALVFGVLWGPYGRAARTLPAFPEFARKVGLAAYWDRHGAPDGCRRVGPPTTGASDSRVQRRHRLRPAADHLDRSGVVGVQAVGEVVPVGLEPPVKVGPGQEPELLRHLVHHRVQPGRVVDRAVGRGRGSAPPPGCAPRPGPCGPPRAGPSGRRPGPSRWSRTRWRSPSHRG